MFDVVLYFPDSINLRAFRVIELSPSSSVREKGSLIRQEGSILEAPMDWEQVDRACEKFGAIVRRMSRL